MSLFLLNTLLFAAAGEPNEGESIPEIALVEEETMIVEAHVDYEVYIAPVQYHVYDENVEAVIPHQMIFNYASIHSKSSKVRTRYQSWEPITMHGGMKVYNEETITYVWDNCNYKREHRACSFKNNHYFLETHITVDENELVISMTLFNSDLQPIGTSQKSSLKTVNWIKQQEVTIIEEATRAGNRTITHMPKEEMPLRWEIPHKLLSKVVYQASIGLWTGLKLN